MRRKSVKLADESGIALIMALGVMLVLTIALTTVITFTAAGARDSKRVNAGQKATALAEAGIGNALAVLHQNYPCTDCFPGNSALLTPARTTTYTTGSVDWSGVLGLAPADVTDWEYEWRLTATGRVSNPTGPGGSPVTRTVRAVVPVIPPRVTDIGDNNPLNFIYARGDITFEQSVIVASPVYATGDLRLESSATISEFIGNDLATPLAMRSRNRLGVEGTFFGLQDANTIGHVYCENKSPKLPDCTDTVPPIDNPPADDPAYWLDEAYIEGQCETSFYSNPKSLHPCVYGDASVSQPRIDQVWANNTGSVIPDDFLEYIPALTCCAPYPDSLSLSPAATPPAFSNMGRLFQTADLGPRSACTTGSLPSTITFDGVGAPDLIDNSATPAAPATPAVDLTPHKQGSDSHSPSDSYICKSARGELSWNNQEKVLTVQGTVFIDGSATVSSPTSHRATVTGQGALILTGTFSMKDALLCVRTTGSGANTKCDESKGAWDPDISAFIVVADGDGGYDATQSQGNVVEAGEGIVLRSSSFQGGLIANKKIRTRESTQMQGPMISVYRDVEAGQTNVLTFPPLSFAPSGGDSAIGPPPVAQLLPPRRFGGG